MEKIKQIVGPIGLYHYFSDEYGMDIYLFADHHILAAKCKNKNSIHISDFISTLIKNPEFKDLTIDLFLESAALIEGRLEKTPSLHSGRSYIQNVVMKLENCIIPIKTNNVVVEESTAVNNSNTSNKVGSSKYGRKNQEKLSCINSNLKIHPFDFRWDNNINIWAYFVSIMRDKKVPDTVKAYEHVQTVIEKLETILKTHNYHNPVDLLVSLYDIDNLMQEQYNNVNNTIKKKIFHYIEENINILIPQGVKEILDGLKLFCKKIRKQNVSRDQDDDDYMLDLSDSLKPYIEAETWVIDYYSFARLFSSYGDANSMQNRDGVKINIRPSHIIYYAGFYHIDSTIGLLRELGFKNLEQTESDHQCLNISRFDPFFSILSNNRCVEIAKNGFRCKNQCVGLAPEEQLCKKHHKK